MLGVECRVKSAHYRKSCIDFTLATVTLVALFPIPTLAPAAGGILDFPLEGN